MQIVIDIPDDLYKSIICHRCKCAFQQKCDYENLKNAIEDGIPLPKGHGRLMILSEDKLEKNQINLDFSCQKWITEIGLSNATVAILGGEKNENKNI